ncbi:hypothetical protein [Bacillus sp. ISL-55]|uniref:hypothetical protein n=1 Tax=Bacillus sp. ISL-55 TaxID=2819134 RepID=UPI001BE7D343|nr:hypothetical protein [Bacillus sp. ISL-55]MBT2694639.1 hypothetical protein [Bacillus sp. ISL-55]
MKNNAQSTNCVIETKEKEFDLFTQLQESRKRDRENKLRNREVTLWYRQTPEETKQRWENEVKNFEEYLIENGRFPTMSEWDSFAKPKGFLSASAFKARLRASWEEVALYFNRDISKKSYSEIELIEILNMAIREVRKEYLSQVDYTNWAKDKGLPSVSQITKQLGGGYWKKALQVADVSMGNSEHEELISILQIATRETGVSHLTIAEYKKWAEGKNLPTAYYISRRLGNGLWSVAVKKAGLKE